ncbi:MAG: aldose 1-epimerase family protein [Alphaproteobacteria bacterium]|nr:aldose 1-epimerase family protein [Alphaproteobacteria bacterium]
MAGTAIDISDGPGRAAVALRGGELRGWSVAGRDLLWPGDPAWWPRSSPILFPIVGWARDGHIRVDGVARPMAVHGFAAGRDFAVVARAADRVALSLRDDAATRAAYPFAFELRVEYVVAGPALRAAFAVGNPGPRPLPYALGLHPGFRWPIAGAALEEHTVTFGADERPEVPVITAAGLFTTRRRPVPIAGRRLRLSPALFAAEALCFLDARSRSLRFADDAGRGIDVAWDGFPHLALWTRPGAPFLCIETWTGHGDPEDFAGDLAEKPSIRLLAPGAVARHAVAFSWRDDGG